MYWHKHNRRNYFALIVLGTVLSCKSAKSPTVSELVPTLPPTIFGQASIALTSTATTFDLAGTCDPKSLFLQYSLDLGTTWITTIKCTTAGKYNFIVPTPAAETIWVRSQTQYSFTTYATANMSVNAPTTSPLLQMVSGGSSPAWSNPGNPTNLTFTMPSTWTGARSSGIVTFNMDLFATGSSFYAP